MAYNALIIAEPGSGKSTSIETLDPKTTFIINCANKPLPFRGWKSLYTPFNSKENTGNMVASANPSVILQVMDIVDKKLPQMKTLVIDDWSLVASFEYMNKSHEVGYQKFTDIGKNIYLIGTKYKDMRDDLTVFYLTHPERSENIDGDSKIKAKTVGKLVDQLIVIEALFTVVLYGKAKKEGKEIKYFFETQTDGETPAKSPKDMFNELRIPNDLELVRSTIVNYNE